MKKALKRAENIIDNNSEFKSPSSTIVEAIISSSMGDLRNAMNQFYLASLIDCGELETVVEKSQGTKRKRASSKVTVKNMLRDEALGLFHGLGRILNPKFKEDTTVLQLNCDVEKLVDEFSVQPTNCINFLFENYLKYFGDIVDSSQASEYLILAQRFLCNWGEDRQNIVNYAVWLGILGLMINNRHKQAKWTQITGPRKITYKRNSEINPMDRTYFDIINKNVKNSVFK